MRISTFYRFLSCLACLLMLARPATAQDELQEKEDAAIQAAVAHVADSIVRIETIGGSERVGDVTVGSGPCTGVIVDADGYIISSSFHFMQKPSAILVTLPEGNRVAARIVSHDLGRKLVLLKIETKTKLAVPQAAKKSDMQIGQWAIAVGKTLSEESPNVSVGILSAVNRIWNRALQTDAKISAMNYGGALVDIQGRVMGVLVPLSQDSNDEVAGVEWYDAGIGFAIPLEDIFARLEKLKQADVHPGLMGIFFRGQNVIADKAIVASCLPTSPAAEAGLKTGDEIIGLNGITIGRQTEFKHAIGNIDAGEQVKIKIRRDDKELELQLQLASEILPWDQPFLGILPDRNVEHVTVRYVFAESGAAKAGVKPGDRLQAVNGEPIANIAELWNQITNLTVGDKIQLQILRGEAELELTCQTTPVLLDIPTIKPALLEEKLDRNLQTGSFDVKIVDEDNRCLAIVPENINRFTQLGLVVLVQAPEALDQAKIERQWKATCEARGWILIAVEPLDTTAWSRTEIGFFRKVISKIMREYPVDPRRVAVMGENTGGSFGLLLAMSERELIRGVVALGGDFPRGVSEPNVDPQFPLAIYWAQLEENPESPFEKIVSILEAKKFPIVSKQGSRAEELLPEILDWLDSLDRL